MKVYLVRDINGALKCFYKARPVRHSIIGTWESKPAVAKEYFLIPSEMQTHSMMKISWNDEPVMVEMTLKFPK